MECKSCGNSMDDIAFIGSLCIDCYSEALQTSASPAGSLLRRASTAARRAMEDRVKRRTTTETREVVEEEE